MPTENGDGESNEEQDMKLDHITPLDTTIDYQVGYTSGQRACRSNAYLNRAMQRNVAMARLGNSHCCNPMNVLQFIKGFLQGYQDEREGLAQPLPSFDYPYASREVYFE